MMPRSGRAAAIIFVLAASCGKDEASLAWKIRFASGELEARMARVEARVLRGGCGGDPIFVKDVGQAMTPPKLDAGTYGFAARAADTTCLFYAEGCTTVALPSEGREVVVTLDALASTAAACSEAEACVSGRCDSGVEGTIDFRGDWETGDYSQWTEISYDTTLAFQDQLRVVSSPDPVRQGRFAARFAIPALSTKNKIQAEWGSDENAGSEYWYAWSTLFPSDWIEPAGYGEVVRWTSAAALPPVIRFDARADTMTILVQSGDTDGSTFAYDERTLLLDSLHKGAWNDFIVHVRWSADADGTLQVWHRAEGEAGFTRRACLRDIPTVQRPSTGPLVHHVRQGLAREQSSFENVLFHDGFRRGTSGAAVAADYGVTFAPDARCP